MEDTVNRFMWGIKYDYILHDMACIVFERRQLYMITIGKILFAIFITFKFGNRHGNGTANHVNYQIRIK